MRVLYDISTLGFAHLYRQSRGGAYRAELHISEGLAASSECELFFCANHSTVAYHGCEAFLREHQRLRTIPLVGSRASGGGASIGAVASAVHRNVRRLFGTNVLPSAVRGVAASVDRRIHRPAGGAESAVDVLHTSPAAPLPFAPRRGSPHRFLTVYDLAFVRFPHIYGDEHRHYLSAALGSLKPPDHVITTSRFVRDELVAERVAAADRIHVVPLAADPALFYRCVNTDRIDDVRRKYSIPDGPYVLGVNTPDVRKNVPRAVDAFARASGEGGGVIGSLVLTGHPGAGSHAIQQAIAAYPYLQRRIVLTGYVPDEDLAPLYSGAQQFVYSSLYEGFGLPPLEAMQCGTPVITSNTSSLPEVVGDGGLMVEPTDLDALAGAMLELATDRELRGRLQQRALAQAARFSWDLTTAATLGAYRTALQS